MLFDGSQKKVGAGAQAEVLLYKGFAYKVYKPAYPSEWIAFEKTQQKAVNKAGLCPIRYYDTDDPHIIRMDYIDGITLETRIKELTDSEKGRADTFIPQDQLVNTPEEGFRLLADAFRFVHKADAGNVAIPNLRETASMGMSKEDAEKVLQIIEALSEKYPVCICHLDMHFLNIMLPHNKKGYVLIDWMNTRLAPAVFDYARTYVIFQEFSKVALALYKQSIMQDLQALDISDADFNAALQACKIIRQVENTNNQRTPMQASGYEP